MTRLSDLVTPALIVDRDRLNANISEMAARAKALGVALRPHAKTHKSPAIAALDRGARHQTEIGYVWEVDCGVGRFGTPPNLHSEMHVVEQDEVVDAWPVATREWREIEAERTPAWSTR